MTHHTMTHTMTDTMTDTMQKCVQDCTECHNICMETLAYCISMGGKHVEATHLQSLMDCAESCATSANFMLRNSGLHMQMCGVCADACERCATNCEQFSGDAQMKACADMCRRCAESCRQMAGMKM